MFIFFADMHQTPRAWAGRWAVEGDAYCSLDQLAAHVEGTGCSGVLSGGDFFDSNTPDAQSLHYAEEFARRLKAKGVPFYYINGQHDRGSGGYSVLETYGAHHIDRTAIDIDGCRVYGLSYRTGDELMEELAAVPECDYLLLHGACRHLLGFEGRYIMDVAEDIPAHVKNVLVGDIHVHDVSKFGTLTVYSPGSAYAASRDEIGKDHGFFEFKAGGAAYVPFRTRRFVNADLTKGDRDGVMAELAQLAQGAAREPLPPVVMLRADPGAEVDAARLPGIIIVREPAGAPAEAAADCQAAPGAGCSLRDGLALAVDKAADAELYEFTGQLLDRPACGEYLAAYIKEAGAATVER